MTSRVSAVLKLLTALVDDAGLFPPERLPMPAAVARHRADAQTGHPVLTHRFLCPGSRLAKLRAELDPEESWRLGLVADTGLDACPAQWLSSRAIRGCAWKRSKYGCRPLPIRRPPRTR